MADVATDIAPAAAEVTAPKGGKKKESGSKQAAKAGLVRQSVSKALGLNIPPTYVAKVIGQKSSLNKSSAACAFVAAVVQFLLEDLVGQSASLETRGKKGKTESGTHRLEVSSVKAVLRQDPIFAPLANTIIPDSQWGVYQPYQKKSDSKELQETLAKMTPAQIKSLSALAKQQAKKKKSKSK